MQDGDGGVPSVPADWYPDPIGRHEHRWWNGECWTEHVASHGRQSVDPVMDPKTISGTTAPEKIQRQVGKAVPAQMRVLPAAEHPHAGDSPPPPRSSAPLAPAGLLDRRVVVVNQKVKLIEVNTEFALYDEQGAQVGAVRQVGQSKAKKVIRFLGDLDQYFTHKYQVVDASGAVILGLTRPAKFVKSRVIVTNDVGSQVGEIVQQNVFGKIRFAYIVNGQDIGGIFAENWRAWNFSLKDASGNEVARITKTFEGLLKTSFTQADNYVLQVHGPLSDPLRQMVFASAVTIDTALKQDARGLNASSILDFG